MSKIVCARVRGGATYRLGSQVARSLRGRAAILELLLVFGAVLVPSAALATAKAEITTNYSSKIDIAQGAFVSTALSGAQSIEPLTDANIESFLGVNLADAGGVIALKRTATDSASNNVATTGRAIALVSDENGSIGVNSLLSASSLDGVAALAAGGAAIVARATESFGSGNSGAQEEKIQLTNGQIKTVHIGAIEVEIMHVANSNAGFAGLSAWLGSIAGKTVSPLRIFSILVILLAYFIVIGVFVYAMIKNTIVQSSRNPLASSVIMRNLLKIFGLLMAITCAVLLAIIIILRF